MLAIDLDMKEQIKTKPKLWKLLSTKCFYIQNCAYTNTISIEVNLHERGTK
jgi:hypothetical protein